MNTRKLKKFLCSLGLNPYCLFVDSGRIVAFTATTQTLIGVVREMALSDDFDGVVPIAVGDDVYMFPDFPWEDDCPADKPEIMATKTFDMMSHINWSHLANQRAVLMEQYNYKPHHVLAGLVCLIDNIQRAAVADGIAEEREVFK